MIAIEEATWPNNFYLFRPGLITVAAEDKTNKRTHVTKSWHVAL